MRRRPLASLLTALGVLALVAGITGIILGRLGETTWAPASEHVATVRLKDAGPAVVIDPGVLYTGGHQGTVTVTAPADVTVIPATPEDIDAYLGDAHRTRITGVPDWSTLSAKDVNPEGSEDLSGIAQADLWPAPESTGSRTAHIDIADFWKAENDPPQPYRAVLLVTDGKQAGATTVSISWPSEETSAWARPVLIAGIITALLGIPLLVLGLLRHRRRPAAGGSGAAAAPARGRRRAIVVDEDADAIHHPTASARPGAHAAGVEDGPREDETDILPPVRGQADPPGTSGPAAADPAPDTTPTADDEGLQR